MWDLVIKDGYFHWQRWYVRSVSLTSFFRFVSGWLLSFNSPGWCHCNAFLWPDNPNVKIHQQMIREYGTITKSLFSSLQLLINNVCTFCKLWLSMFCCTTVDCQWLCYPHCILWWGPYVLFWAEVTSPEICKLQFTKSPDSDQQVWSYCQKWDLFSVNTCTSF